MHKGYIGTERQLYGAAAPNGLRTNNLTHDQAAGVVVDELMNAWREFRHTKLKGDLLHFIERALYLQQLGYQLTLDRRHDCVGAHKRNSPAEGAKLIHACIGPKGGAHLGANVG